MIERSLTHSYGGGTQSCAIAVLIAQGRLPLPERIVIADTGREASETWEYLERHIQPLLATVGATVEIASHDLSTVDLYSPKEGTLLIPAYTISVAKGYALSNFCSSEWKKAVVRRYLRAAGYGPDRPVTTWIGISLDEVGRAKPSELKWQELTWPLLDFGFRRHDCRRIVVDAGLPEPPRSSCWMCPYRRATQWRHLRDNYPADFAKAVALDATIREQDIANGNAGVYLHKSRVPLAEADLREKDEQVGQGSLFGEVEGCDSGMCWT
jgi:hypothetical protein